MVSSTPRQKTRTGQPERCPLAPSCTGTLPSSPGMRVTKPASMKPMKAMNRPIPTLIACFSEDGMACMTASRSPVTTRTQMRMPSSTTSPIASGQLISGAIWKAIDGVEAETGGDGEREVAAQTHDRGHDGSHQRGGGGEFRPGQLVAELVLGTAEDDRVEHQNVGHREERGEAAADLPREGRTSCADPEVLVDLCGHGSPRGVIRPVDSRIVHPVARDSGHARVTSQHPRKRLVDAGAGALCRALVGQRLNPRTDRGCCRAWRGRRSRSRCPPG